jgi:hypothetical protein
VRYDLVIERIKALCDAPGADPQRRTELFSPLPLQPEEQQPQTG